ncbi:MAG: HEAT repeat domain-containing protein [Pseudomonadota bacterium]|nr:HEAT repeat domain-containing protein [Pseudomonadota bacterium]
MPLIRKPDKDARKPATPQPADLLRTLTQGDADARWSAARAAADLPDGVDALAAALPNETDARVREAMLTSLARIGSPRSVDAIVPLLRVDDAGVRTAALDALRAMPDAVRAQLPALLQDDDSDVRILCCEIARTLPRDEATRLLGELLTVETEVNVSAAAIDVLAEIGGPAALPALDRCAERFAGTTYLEFAIRIARGRILAQSTEPHD